MRFAYADPPYPGQSATWYANHPDYAGEVDHRDLIDRLEAEYPDGWELSTSSLSLQYVLSLCPTDPPVAGFTLARVGGVRVAAWHRDLPAPRGTSRLMITWEPVIVRGGRQERDALPGFVWDSLRCPSHVFGREDRITGGKPARFSRWVFELLGATPDDELDDLFPGSGAVGREWSTWQSQTRLPV